MGNVLLLTNALIQRKREGEKALFVGWYVPTRVVFCMIHSIGAENKRIF